MSLETKTKPIDLVGGPCCGELVDAPLGCLTWLTQRVETDGANHYERVGTYVSMGIVRNQREVFNWRGWGR